MDIYWGGWMGVNSERRVEISWEMSNEPRLGDLEGDLVRKYGWVWIWGIRWRFPGKFSIIPRLGDVEGCVIGNSRWTLAWWWAPIFGWNFWMEPGLVILKDFGPKLWWCGARAIQRILGWAVSKNMSLSPSDGSGVGWCVDFGVLVGLADGRLLKCAKTKVARLCWHIPLCWRIISIVEYRP